MNWKHSCPWNNLVLIGCAVYFLWGSDVNMINQYNNSPGWVGFQLVLSKLNDIKWLQHSQLWWRIAMLLLRNWWPWKAIWCKQSNNAYWTSLRLLMIKRVGFHGRESCCTFDSKGLYVTRTYDPKTITCRSVRRQLMIPHEFWLCVNVVICIVLMQYSKTNPLANFASMFWAAAAKKGEHFCSHSLGFQICITQEEFDKFYRVNPLCVQATLTANCTKQTKEEKPRDRWIMIMLNVRISNAISKSWHCLKLSWKSNTCTTPPNLHLRHIRLSLVFFSFDR